MKHRQTILMVMAGSMLGGYAFKTVNSDTLPDAANRFGQAVLSSDIDTIWTLVPQDEREFYKFDKKKFAQYWNQFVAPKLKGFDSYMVSSHQSMGLSVILKSSRPEMKLCQASWLVTGELGNYYVPYTVAYTNTTVAGVDPNETRSDEYVIFEKYSTWMDENKAAFHAMGIDRIRRGPIHEKGQSYDDVRDYYIMGMILKKYSFKLM